MDVIVLHFSPIGPEAHSILFFSTKIKEASEAVVEKEAIADAAVNADVEWNIFIERIFLTLVGIGICSPHREPLSQKIQRSRFVSQSEKMLTLLAYLGTIDIISSVFEI